MTVIIFLVVLAVLIFVHELGHFIVARLCGIRVDVFAIGFGPKIISWTKGETKYALNAIPFGGYVKIFGENPDEESLSGPDSKRSFVNKNRALQVAVLVAGVVFNFVFAWLIYAVVFMSGTTVSTVGFENYSKYFEQPRIVVTNVLKNSPADNSGIKAGDILPYSSTKDFTDYINSSKGQEFKIDYVREGKSATASIVATTSLIKDKLAIGVSMESVAEIQLPFVSALWKGAHYTIVMIQNTTIGLWDFVTSIFVGNADFDDVSGPIGIAKVIGTSASMGFKYLMMITAIISINLGIINLVPFPALDGGRTLFVIIEAIFRRRIPAQFANTVNGIGFALLMLLMVFVTYKDILKLF